MATPDPSQPGVGAIPEQASGGGRRRGRHPARLRPPELRQYLRDSALMWLEDCRIDGLRWETTGYIADVGGGSDPGADLEGAGLMR